MEGFEDPSRWQSRGIYVAGKKYTFIRIIDDSEAIAYGVIIHKTAQACVIATDAGGGLRSANYQVGKMAVSTLSSPRSQEVPPNSHGAQ